MNNTIFKLDNVTYAYPQGDPVLKDISLSIYEGEKLASSVRTDAVNQPF